MRATCEAHVTLDNAAVNAGSGVVADGGRAVERHIIWHEGLALRRRSPFDHRMPCVDDRHFVALMHVRLDVLVERGNFGERR